MKYNGLTNIWLNIKNLSRFPYNSEDFMSIDHLKCKNGYCFLSRSKIMKNISIDFCINMEHMKITKKDLHTFNTNDLILCKLPNWNTYVLGRIINIVDTVNYGNEEEWCFENKLCVDNEKIKQQFGNGYFNIYFPCCPDSDIYLTWQYGKTIVRERTMLTYKNIIQNIIQKNEIYKVENKMKKSKSYDSFAPFCFNESDSDSDNEEINKCIEDMILKVIDVSKPKYIIHSGLFDKKDSSTSELLRYNLAWLNYNDNYISISKKPINISYNNIEQKFLSNVAIIHQNHLKYIIKIQCKAQCGMKIINKDNFTDKEKRLEPQDAKFFKKYFEYTHFLNTKRYLYTYTGQLCTRAKKYLFSINKIDIK